MSAAVPLPHAIIEALARWQALRKGLWSVDEAGLSLAALETAAKAAFDSGREALSRALDDLVLYLSFLVDAGIAPGAAQSQKLGNFEAAVMRLLRDERDGPAAVDPRKRILVLAPEVPLWRSLVERIGSPQLRIECFVDPVQLLEQLDTAGLAAVLIDEQYLFDLGGVADRLEGSRGAEQLGATIVFFNRARDLSHRILALSSGADASLEGEDLDHLVARVAEWIDVRNRQENLRVLVVDDDRSQAMYCDAVLRKQGIDVRIAGNSRQALADIQSFRPDLVLMDLHMPEIDGMQLTALIREDAEFALLPIVFVTGEQDESSRFDAMRAGGDDYLVKPVRPRHLVTAVVTRARRARSLKRQFSYRAGAKSARLLHAGEFIGLLRTLGPEQPGKHVLMMAAADSGRLRPEGGHLVVERENQFQILKQLQDSLNGEERLAPWQGGAFVMLLDELPDDALSVRAEAIREALSALLAARGAGPASVAIVPLIGDAVPSAEVLIDLCERTLAVARHAGGKRVVRALAEVQSDLPAELSLAIQKALALAPSALNTSALYQPIVALHGATRPQYHLHLGLKIDLDGGRAVSRRDWLPLGRQTGRAIDFDRYAVLSVLDLIVAQRRRSPGLRVFIAVNGESLIDPGFCAALFDGLIERQLVDSGLVISIDHSEAMMYQTKLAELRPRLAAAHVLFGIGRVGLDTKGAGIIDTLRPELIAVDAVSVRATAQTPPILSFARDRGIEVVAHFIPDAQTLARLFALGIDYGLGSFIGAPSPRCDYDFGD